MVGINSLTISGIWGWLILVWLVVLTVLVSLFIYRYQQLTKGVKGDNLDKIVRRLAGEQERIKKAQIAEEKSLTVLEELAKDYMQKVAIVRYNPFNQTGGNQSFSLALLDGRNNGIVISSFHNRDGTRLYAKSVKIGKTDDSFSQEEKAAIKEALKQS
jgi:predicted phosphohydrolase